MYPTNNLEILANAWNSLSVQILESKISEYFLYNSQFVPKKIQSKSAFIEHLERKFNAIRVLKDFGRMSVTAELGYHPSLNNRACIILTQIIDGKTEKVMLLIDEVENLITNISVCHTPDPEAAILKDRKAI
jgi:hypothetical protein